MAYFVGQKGNNSELIHTLRAANRRYSCLNRVAHVLENATTSQVSSMADVDTLGDDHHSFLDKDELVICQSLSFVQPYSEILKPHCTTYSYLRPLLANNA